MVTLGTDAHKRSHTIVAADEQGRQVGQVTVTATPEGHLRALGWAGQWAQRRWAIEDCRHLSRRLERDLLGAGEQLVRVPPKLMAATRRGARTRGKSDPIDAVAAEIARELVARCRDLTVRVNQLERQLAGLVAPLTPGLLALAGCGALTAAKLVGETAGLRRFRSRAAFAMHNGTAPIPVWSANRERHRLNRGGNRQLNAALHRIAVTQLRLGGAGRAYYQHRITQGDTKTEAIRALRRRISDEVYRRLEADERQRRTQPTCQRPTA